MIFSVIFVILAEATLVSLVHMYTGGRFLVLIVYSGLLHYVSIVQTITQETFPTTSNISCLNSSGLKC